MAQVAETVLSRRPWLVGRDLYSFGFSKRGPRTEAGAEGLPSDVEIGDRLVAAYLKAVSDFPPEPGPSDVWTYITDNFQRDLIEMLRAGDGAALVEYLSALPRHDAGHGFLQGRLAYEALVNNPAEQSERALWLMDHLVGMAEAVGVLNTRCPEQGDYASPPVMSTVDRLVEAIQDKTGLPIALPPVFEGFFALESASGPVHLRTLVPAYAVWQVSRALRHASGKQLVDAHIAEIGAGVGFSALAAQYAGIGTYSIYDLPEVNVAQGYFTLSTMPSGTVELYGEQGKPPHAQRARSDGPRVRILPAQAFAGEIGGSFDVVLNIDSLPEIAQPLALDYLEHIRVTSKMFFSVNQEAGSSTVLRGGSGGREATGVNLWRFRAGLSPTQLGEGRLRRRALGLWHPMTAMRMLGVLLCYNDGDIVEEAVRYLREQGHHLVVWDHGSTDSTPQVLESLKDELLELQMVPRSLDFYELYPTMSRHLLKEHVANYDWVSWPDQDEFLEGPDRSRSYRDWVTEVIASPYDWVEFNNYNYWWTADDRAAVSRATDRVKHYAIFLGCAPRIRAWRARATNIRQFNHNPPEGQRYPQLFNLRHYPMRDHQQMLRRLEVDRAGLRRGKSNFHYENMSTWRDRLVIPPGMLHVDDGGDLDPSPVFDWRTIYGW